MKKIISAFCFIALISITSTAQTWPSSVTGITTLANDSVVTEGNLSNGKIITLDKNDIKEEVDEEKGLKLN